MFYTVDLVVQYSMLQMFIDAVFRKVGLFYQIWPIHYFFTRRASYHFKAYEFINLEHLSFSITEQNIFNCYTVHGTYMLRQTRKTVTLRGISEFSSVFSRQTIVKKIPVLKAPCSENPYFLKVNNYFWNSLLLGFALLASTSGGALKIPQNVFIQ